MSRLFELNEASINQILFCDNSDSEECLTLDDEDINFLGEDLETAKEIITQNDERIEVCIDSASASNSSLQQLQDIHSHVVTDQHGFTSSTSISETSLNSSFNWKKLKPNPQSSKQRSHLGQKGDLEYGKVLKGHSGDSF